jgi:uncharacterized protein (TIGR02270 family)
MIIEDIITQHAEDAAFLWLLRDSAVHEPHYDLKDLTELDNRVEAHLDGLRIAGDAGWEICKDALIYEEPGEIFTASVLAFTSNDQERIDTVLEAGSNDPELARAIISALGWLRWQEVDKPALLDTIILEPDARRFMLVWRAALPLKRNMFEMEMVVIGDNPEARKQVLPDEEPTFPWQLGEDEETETDTEKV